MINLRKIKVLVLLTMVLCSLKTQAFGYFPDESLSKTAELNASGKIKFREDWTYQLIDGKIISVGTKVGYERYDRLGQKLEEANYDRNGKPLIEVTYTYDDYGREEHCLGWKENKSFFNKWNYAFNEKSKTLTKTNASAGCANEKLIYQFDDNGNVVDEIHYDLNGKLSYHYQMCYTKFKELMELKDLGANGEIFERWVYKYNQQNINTEVMVYNGSEELSRKYINIYNADGIRLEVITVDNEGNAYEKTVSKYQFY